MRASAQPRSLAGHLLERAAAPSASFADACVSQMPAGLSDTLLAAAAGGSIAALFGSAAYYWCAALALFVAVLVGMLVTRFAEHQPDGMHCCDVGVNVRMWGEVADGQKQQMLSLVRSTFDREVVDLDPQVNVVYAYGGSDPDGPVLGMLLLRRSSTVDFVTSFCVDPARRRSGIGAQILHRAMDSHRDGIPMVLHVDRGTPDSNNLLRYYSHRGWDEVVDQAFVPDGSTLVPAREHLLRCFRFV